MRRARARGVALRVAGGALLVGVAAAAVATGFGVEHVVVRGVADGRAEEVRQAALADVGSESLLRVDASSLAARLEALPTVRTAAVDRAFPNGLAITVEPEVPAAVVPLGRDRYLVARSGRVIGRATAHAGLPFLAAAPADVPPPGGTITAPGVLAELEVANALPPRSALLVTGVQELAGDLVARSKRGYDVHLGDGGDLRRKLLAAAAAVHALGPIDGGQVAYVDVSEPDRPAVRTAAPNPSTLEPPSPIVLEGAGGATPATDAATTDSTLPTPSADAGTLILDLFGRGA